MNCVELSEAPRDLVRRHLADAANGWSVGTWGAIGEFQYDEGEPGLVVDAENLSVSSRRGALRVGDLAEVKPFALVDEKGRIREIAFCSARPASGRTVIHALDAVTFDLGIGALPLDNPGIESQPLLSLPAVIVLPPAHPLASRKSLGARDLAAETLVVLGPGTQLRHDVEAMFAADGLTIHPTIVVDSLEFACRLVAQGSGVTIADPLTPATLGAGRLAMVPWRPRTLFHVGVLRPALMPSSPSVERFVECLRREGRQLGGRLARA